jgi:hypothetical protein
MDQQSMAPAAPSLGFLYGNIAKAIKNVTEKYNADRTTSAQGSGINKTLMEIQSLLRQPHTLSPRVISQFQLEEPLQNAESSCNATVSKLQEEARKWMGNQTTTGESPRNEVQIRVLLQQIQRQLMDINSLIAAAQRYSKSGVLCVERSKHANDI